MSALTRKLITRASRCCSLAVPCSLTQSPAIAILCDVYFSHSARMIFRPVTNSKFWRHFRKFSKNHKAWQFIVSCQYRIIMNVFIGISLITLWSTYFTLSIIIVCRAHNHVFSLPILYYFCVRFCVNEHTNRYRLVVLYV